MSRRIPSSVTFPAERVETDVGELVLPSDDLVLLPYMRRTGTWEPTEGRLLRSLMTRSSRFLDVGAHVGYFSAMAARICPSGTIDAVEPNPRNADCLELNLWAHAPQAQVWRTALGATRTVAGLTFDAANSGNTRITESTVVAANYVAMVTADELFDDRQFDVVKIDVQGFEDQVIRGMQRLIRRSRDICIVAEFYPTAIRARGELPGEVLKLYRALGLERIVSIDDQLSRIADEEILALCESAGREGFVNLLLRHAT